MSFESLRLKIIRARPSCSSSSDPVVARMMLTEWPLILIDLYAEGATILDGLPKDVPRYAGREVSLSSIIRTHIFGNSEGYQVTG